MRSLIVLVVCAIFVVGTVNAQAEPPNVFSRSFIDNFYYGTNQEQTIVFNNNNTVPIAEPFCNLACSTPPCCPLLLNSTNTNSVTFGGNREIALQASQCDANIRTTFAVSVIGEAAVPAFGIPPSGKIDVTTPADCVMDVYYELDGPSNTGFGVFGTGVTTPLNLLFNQANGLFFNITNDLAFTLRIRLYSGSPINNSTYLQLDVFLEESQPTNNGGIVQYPVYYFPYSTFTQVGAGSTNLAAITAFTLQFIQPPSGEVDIQLWMFSPFSINIRGRVYVDCDNDCSFDSGELGIVGITVTATPQSGSNPPVVVSTDNNGEYNLGVSAPSSGNTISYQVCISNLGTFETGFTVKDCTAGVGQGTQTRCRLVSVTISTGAEGINFGIYRPPIITPPVTFTAPCTSTSTAITVPTTQSGNPSVTPYVPNTNVCVPSTTFSDVKVACSAASSGQFTVIRTFTATDAAGATVTTTQQINVLDQTAPTVVAPPSVTVTCASVAVSSSGTVSDACTIYASASTSVSSSGSTSDNCNGSYQRTFVATDACGGRSNSATQTVFVRDVTPPTLTIPASSSTTGCAVGGNAPTSSGFPGTAAATDSCFGTIIPTYTDVNGGNVGCTISVRRQWTASDPCFNTAVTQTQIINFTDDAAPQFNNQPTVTTIGCGASLPTVTATDNCGTPTIDVGNNPSTIPRCGTFLRTYTARDGCGQSATFVQTVTVTDTTPPQFTNFNPNGANVPCANIPAFLSNPTATLPFSAITDNCVGATPTFTSDDFIASGPGSRANFVPSACQATYVRIYTAVDACSNTATATVIYTSLDTIPPVVTPPAAQTVDCSLATADRNTIATTPIASANDNCSGSIGAAAITFDNNGGDIPDCVNGFVRRWYASDSCFAGLGSATQAIRFRDNTAPSFNSIPSPVTVGCNVATSVGSPSFPNAGATDNCVGVRSISSGDSIVSTNACSTVFARTFTATDDCSNSATVVQTFTVADLSGPSITAPTDPNTFDGCRTSNLSGVAGPGTFDDCGQATLSPPVDVANRDTCTATITRTWTVTDRCGNSASVSRDYTFTDTTPPVFAPQTLGPFDCSQFSSFDPATSSVPSATDLCNTVTVTFSTFSDFGAPTTCSRTIERTFIATDGCQTASITQTIVFSDNTNPTVQATAVTATLECDSTYNFLTAPLVPDEFASVTQSDNCNPDDAALTSGEVYASRTCSTLNNVPRVGATIVRTYTATDLCGRTATSAVTFFIVDNTNPFITAPNDYTTACNDDGSTTAAGVASGFDSCDTAGVDISSSDSPLSTRDPCNRTVVRTWFARDDCGNQNSVTQLITFQDTDPPAFVNLQDAYETFDCTTAISPRVTGSDPCQGVATVDSTVISSTGFCPTSVLYEFTASDGCGQTVTAQRTLSVTDLIPPTFDNDEFPATYTSTDCVANNLNPDPTVSGSPLSQTDNCNELDDTDFLATLTYSTEPVQNPTNCIAEAIRTWTTQDACSNTATRTQLIRVIDATPATIDAPPSGTVGCDFESTGGSTVPSETPQNPVFGLPTVVEDCQTVTPTYTDTILPGCGLIIQRVWSVSDGCQTTASVDTQIITFVDDTPPSFDSFPDDIEFECTDTIGVQTLPSNIGGAAGYPEISDICDSTPELTYRDSIPGALCPNAITYVRTYTASDACDNTATSVQTITVDVTDSPLVFPPASTTIDCADSTLPAFTGTATASQDCSIGVDITYFDNDALEVSTECGTTITREWYGTDRCLNQGVATQTIQVTDTRDPTFALFPDDVTLTCEDSTDPSVTGYPLAYDNCVFPVCNVTYSDSPLVDIEETQIGSCVADQRFTRTWTAFDNCGNSISQTQTITIDYGTPGAQCPAFNCEQEDCLPCECEIESCECCQRGGNTPCSAVPCTPVACTAVSCRAVDCIPCPTLEDDTLSPLPQCDDSVPCIPNIIPIFVDDDGTTNEDETSDQFDSGKYFIKYQYWKDKYYEGRNNRSNDAAHLAPMVAILVLLLSLPLTMYGFLFNH